VCQQFSHQVSVQRVLPAAVKGEDADSAPVAVSKHPTATFGEGKCWPACLSDSKHPAFHTCAYELKTDFAKRQAKPSDVDVGGDVDLAESSSESSESSSSSENNSGAESENNSGAEKEKAQPKRKASKKPKSQWSPGELGSVVVQQADGTKQELNVVDTASRLGVPVLVMEGNIQGTWEPAKIPGKDILTIVEPASIEATPILNYACMTKAGLIAKLRSQGMPAPSGRKQALVRKLLKPRISAPPPRPSESDREVLITELLKPPDISRPEGGGQDPVESEAAHEQEQPSQTVEPPTCKSPAKSPVSVSDADLQSAAAPPSAHVVTHVVDDTGSPDSGESEAAHEQKQHSKKVEPPTSESPAKSPPTKKPKTRCVGARSIRASIWVLALPANPS